MKRKLLMITSLLFVLVLLLAGCFTPQTEPAATRTVTDLVDREVEIPAEVERVAALCGPSYDKVFMLGEKEKVVMVGFPQGPWAELLNPDLKEIAIASNPKAPNIEELLELDVDVVFTWGDPDELLMSKENAGIPAVASINTIVLPDSAEKFIGAIKGEINLHAEVLGPEAEARAKKYFDYLDEAIEQVTSVTSELAEHEKPKVYYVNDPGLLATHGKYTSTRWFVEMAGGNLVSKELEQNLAEVNIEQIMAWDPDIVMMGRVDSTEPVLNNPAWSEITAVKKGQVYINPKGVFHWDFGVEGPLLLKYLAKTFHPDKFAGIDMVAEVKDFYNQFFDYQLSDEQANKILQHQEP